VPQAEALEALLDKRGAPLAAVVNLEAPVSELKHRLASRSEKEGRSDDTEEAVEQRLKEYDAKTAPLGDFYRERGLLRDVNAVGSIDEVSERVFAVLDQVEGGT
jgi:adenylate kinase